MKLRIRRVLLYLNIILNIICITVIIGNNIRKEIAPGNVQERKDELASTDKRYEKEKEVYRRANDSLKMCLSQSDSLLKQKQYKIKSLQQELQVQLREDWNNLPVGIHLEKCDSLKQTVIRYEKERAFTDSFNLMWKEALNELVAVKDKQVDDCERAYQQMKHTLELSISDSEALKKQEEKLNRKLKRQKILNRVLTVGAVGIAAIAGVFMLKQ